MTYCWRRDWRYRRKVHRYFGRGKAPKFSHVVPGVRDGRTSQLCSSTRYCQHTKFRSSIMADPFEVRMRFTSQLQHLNASVNSSQKAAHYALKYRDMDEDLHSCILEQLERVYKFSILRYPRLEEFETNSSARTP